MPKQRDVLPDIIPRRFTTIPQPKKGDPPEDFFIQVPIDYVVFDGNHLKVWMWAHRRYNSTYRHAWQGYAEMADDLSIAPKTVQRSVNWLVANRALIRLGQKYPGAKNTNKLIALTKRPTQEEFDDWTGQLEAHINETKEVRLTSIKRSDFPDKEVKLSIERGQIDRRSTSMNNNQEEKPSTTSSESAVAVDVSASLKDETPTSPKTKAGGDEGAASETQHNQHSDSIFSVPSSGAPTESERSGSGQASNPSDAPAASHRPDPELPVPPGDRTQEERHATAGKFRKISKQIAPTANPAPKRKEIA